jgi:transcription antitermination factor NusG
MTARTAAESWFALIVKHQHEKVIARLLRSKGYEEFLPLYAARRRWSDRTKVAEVPLFPGYVFCRFDWKRRLPILKTPGVTSIVTYGTEPAPVEDAEIDAIQRIVSSDLPIEPHRFIKVGDRARVNQGPLEGLEGILISEKNSWRVVVQVSLLKRSVAVEIDRELLTPIP